MKPKALLDAGSSHVLGFQWLANALAPVSPYGERLFTELVPFLPGEEPAAQSRANAVADLAGALEADRIEGVRAALRDLPDAAGAIARASMGDVLDDPNFLELSRFCETIERIDALLGDIPAAKIANAAVRALGAALAPGLGKGGSFYLADGFDAGLESARTRYRRDQAELDAARGRESESAARALARDEIAGDEFIAMRSDLHGPLPEGVRVVREAPTYLLCALEYGEASLAALRRRDAAALDVAQVEENVRARLSEVVREHAVGLGTAAAGLGKLDVLLAAARFTQRNRCVTARITRELVLDFEQARFLPLEAELAEAGRRFVPLDLALHDAVVLTGPNMGGKSVSLQTCGFVALCAAFGVPVPAARARAALFDQIAWLGIGRDDRMGGLLSSFAREVLELKEIFQRAAPRLLILVDEFARTTTPHEGRALLVALLARLREQQACGMVATHLEGIAQAVRARHFAVRGLRGTLAHRPEQDVDAALQTLAQSMDYTIAEVTGDPAAQADAIALTSLLGIDDEFVDAAYRALLE